jgi:hypothetical protein
VQAWLVSSHGPMQDHIADAGIGQYVMNRGTDGQTPDDSFGGRTLPYQAGQEEPRTTIPNS